MDKKIIFNKFDSLEAFSNWLQVTPQTEKGKEYNDSIKNSFSFTGTESFEVAQNLLKYGDKENADKIAATIRKIKAQGKGNETRNSLLCQKFWRETRKICWLSKSKHTKVRKY